MRYSIPLALVALLISGCAVESPPVKLHPAAEKPAGSAASIGILPFEDLRPEEQRRGQRPGLVPLLVWNQRIGDYVTGTDTFEDDVAKAVTEEVADTISGRGLGTARVLRESAGEPGGPHAGDCGKTGMKWLVGGTIEDFYATLHQKAYFFIVATPWAGAAGWDNEKTDPLGMVRFKVRMLECATGRNVIDREFRVEKRAPGETLGEAAKAALEEALGELADAVRVASVEASATRGNGGTAGPGVARRPPDGKSAGGPSAQGAPAAREFTHGERESVSLTLKYDGNFYHKFDVGIVIDDEENILLDPDSQVVRQIPPGKHLLRVVDPKKGFFHKPDWSDQEFALNLEDATNSEIQIESGGFFRVFLRLRILSNDEVIAQHEIRTSM